MASAKRLLVLAQRSACGFLARDVPVTPRLSGLAGLLPALACCQQGGPQQVDGRLPWGLRWLATSGGARPKAGDAAPSPAGPQKQALAEQALDAQPTEASRQDVATATGTAEAYPAAEGGAESPAATGTAAAENEFIVPPATPPPAGREPSRGLQQEADVVEGAERPARTRVALRPRDDGTGFTLDIPPLGGYR